MLELTKVDKGQSTELRQGDLCRRGVVARARGEGGRPRATHSWAKCQKPAKNLIWKKNSWNWLICDSLTIFWTYICTNIRNENYVNLLIFFWQKFVIWHQETEFIFGRFLAIWNHCATKGCCTGKLWRRSSGSWQSSLYRYKQQRRQHQDQVVQRLRPREVQWEKGGTREGRKEST